MRVMGKLDDGGPGVGCGPVFPKDPKVGAIFEKTNDNKGPYFWNGTDWKLLLSESVAAELGFTPYDAANPDKFITKQGAPVQSLLGRTGHVTLTQSDVLSALSNGSIPSTLLANGAVANLSGVNTGDQTSVTGNAGTATRLQTARSIAGVAFDGSVDITIDKANIGLGNVDNTSDLNKPVSTAQAAANTVVQNNATTDATTKANSAQANAIAASTPISHVGSTGTAHGVVTAAINGFMSATDKQKLDGISVGATSYTHPATHPATMITGLAAVAMSGMYFDITGRPTTVSALTNDAGYQTSSQVDAKIQSIGLSNWVRVAKYSGKTLPLNGTSIIPADTSVPLSTEGTQIWTQAITPKSTTSSFTIDQTFMIDCSSTSRVVTVAVFRDNVCIYAVGADTTNVGRPTPVAVHVVDSPNTAVSVTYSIRVGVSASATWFLNQNSGSTITYGTASASYWTILETY